MPPALYSTTILPVRPHRLAPPPLVHLPAADAEPVHLCDGLRLLSRPRLRAAKGRVRPEVADEGADAGGVGGGNGANNRTYNVEKKIS